MPNSPHFRNALDVELPASVHAEPWYGGRGGGVLLLQCHALANRAAEVYSPFNSSGWEVNLRWRGGAEDDGRWTPGGRIYPDQVKTTRQEAIQFAVRWVALGEVPGEQVVL